MSDSSLSSNEVKPRSIRVSRRKKTSNRTKAVAELRQNKEMGLSRAQEYALEENNEEKIYDVLNEQEYKELKRKRREKGAFVVDDDGTGYVDNYEDDHYYDYKDDNPLVEKPQAGEKKRRKKIKQLDISDSSNGDINKMFNKIKRTNMVTKHKKVAIALEEAAEREMEKIMEDEVLFDVEENELDLEGETGRTNIECKMVKEGIATPTAEGESHILPKSEAIDVTQNISSPKANMDHSKTRLAELKDRPLVSPKPRSIETISSNTPKDSTMNKAAFKTSPIFGLQDILFNDVPTITEKHENFKVIKAFIYDIYEDKYSSPGKVYLFGKAVVNNETSRRKVRYDRFQPFCMEVKNIKSTFYILKNKAVEQREFDIALESFLDLITIGKTAKNNFSKREIRKKFCFSHQLEIPSKIPNGEYQFTEIMLPAKHLKPNLKNLKIPIEFAGVFNLQQSLTENIVLNRQIKGPSWVYIRNPTLAAQNISWGSMMLSISTPASILPPPQEAVFHDPPMNILSLSIKTVVNDKKHVNEVLSISCAAIKGHKLNNTVTNPQIFTIMRNTNDTSGLSKLLSESKGSGRIFFQKDEKSLLSLFLNKFRQLDPDIVVSHGLLTFDINLLLHRMEKLKIPQWSRLYRLRIERMPRIYRAKGTLIGRLGVDIEHSAKELVMGQKSYALEELVKNLLSVVTYRFWTGDNIKGFVKRNDIENLSLVRSMLEAEPLYCLRLCESAGVLLLTKNVSALCGNLWSRTLSAGRSERIEYFLLHELHRRNLIYPEKFKKNQEHRKRDKYAGGLVLEPKKGLYDQNVTLLLDFNSLYPSIIQEYNYCFTTIGAEDFSQRDTILPEVLHRLVSRRNEVKRLIKTKKAKKERFEILDIRQKALKIIANSIYGCLGFTGSRFYTQTIAENVTARGREMLSSAVELVQSKFGLEVVYGDTDSIMIKTNVSNRIFRDDGNLDQEKMKELSILSKEIRNSVSGNYRVIELGEDGMFLSLLLLKKKKYAALSLSGKSVKKEIKGLDMVRRDWCFMTKKISNKILDVLLNRSKLKWKEEELGSIDCEERIIDILVKFKNEIEEDVLQSRKISKIVEARRTLNKYLITKGLNKDIDEYAKKGNLKSLPHVAVAQSLRAEGKRVKVGDYITYLHVTKMDKSGKQLEKIVMHPEQYITKSALGDFIFSIDKDFYIEQQLIPPIERLLTVVEEINLEQVYKCFELEKSIRTNTALTNTSIDAFSSRENQYAVCSKFKYVCRKPGCKQNFILEKEIKCCPSCTTPVNKALARRLITLETQKFMTEYYSYQMSMNGNSSLTSNKICFVGNNVCFASNPNVEVDARRKLSESELLLQCKYFASILQEPKTGTYYRTFITQNNFNFIKGSVFAKAFGIKKK